MGRVKEYVAFIAGPTRKKGILEWSGHADIGVNNLYDTIFCVVAPHKPTAKTEKEGYRLINKLASLRPI